MKEIIIALGWPHMTFLFAVIFIILFKKPLFGFLSRITSIDKTGIKALQTPEAQREEQKKESAQQLLIEIGESIVLRDIQGFIKTELSGKGLDTEGDTIKVLIKYLAATRLLLDFEQIHNLIFGSQIFLLKKLNQVAGQGAPAEVISAHFQHVQGLFPEQLGKWSIDQYLGFLLNRLLITTQGNVYHITNLGVEYLTWMARNGKTESNPL
jgi:hypothetical protein